MYGIGLLLLLLNGWMSMTGGISVPDRPVWTQRSAFPGRAQVDAVIFDLDGTLVDSLGAWEHSASNFVRAEGLEPFDGLDEKLDAMSLTDGAQFLKHHYALPYSTEEIIQRTLAPIRQHYYNDIAALPGIKQTLARLREQGVKMAVATASDAELTRATLKRLGMLKYFEFILTCDEVGAGKTSPLVYEQALQRLGTSKARTLVAEDALHALQTAQHAGFPTAAIEEAHSAAQRLDKQRAARYYVLSYRGKQVFGR